MNGRAEMLRLSEQLSEERDAAKAIVASIRETMAEVWEKPLPAAWQTAGVVRELIIESRDMLERKPPVSREIAQFAVAVATSLASSSYPPTLLAQVEGEAFRALGNAHRFMTSFDAAFRAYDAAERAFSKSNALSHELTTLHYARALALSAMNRHDEALSLLEKAADGLAEFDDRDGLVKCHLLRAIIHHRRGDFRLARAGYEEALTQAKFSDDLHTLGSCYANLGNVCSVLGDLPAAIDALQSAREIINTLEMPVELARNDWMLGRVLLQQNEWGKAIGILRSVRERFLEFRMIEEAGLTALDLVDALVATDDRQSAVALTEVAIVDFRSSGLNERSLVALGYLRDLLPHHLSPKQPIQYVRTYIEKLRDEPTRAFLPLPE